MICSKPGFAYHLFKLHVIIQILQPLMICSNAKYPSSQQEMLTRQAKQIANRPRKLNICCHAVSYLSNYFSIMRVKYYYNIIIPSWHAHHDQHFPSSCLCQNPNKTKIISTKDPFAKLQKILGIQISYAWELTNLMKTSSFSFLEESGCIDCRSLST
jgi:hypothetical protein